MIYTKCTSKSEIINVIAYLQITLTPASNTLHLHIYTLEKVKLQTINPTTEDNRVCNRFIMANARQLKRKEKLF